MNDGAMIAKVLKLYPEQGCVRVACNGLELDYVMVGQKLRGVYGLPEEGSTVVIYPVNNKRFWVVGDILPKAALNAAMAGYQSKPPDHLDNPKRAKLPGGEALRKHVVIVPDTILETGDGAVAEVG